MQKSPTAQSSQQIQWYHHNFLGESVRNRKYLLFHATNQTCFFNSQISDWIVLTIYHQVSLLLQNKHYRQVFTKRGYAVVLCSLLTLFNEEIDECQHDCVATVKVVPTHVVGASDGQASSCNHLHHSAHLGCPVTKQLQQEGNITKVCEVSVLQKSISKWT